MRSREMVFDLEVRTLAFAKDCINLCRKCKKDTISIELIRQLIRSAGSVGANYREANEGSSKAEFFHRISICRREAKESAFWLELLAEMIEGRELEVKVLIDESLQLAKIFAAICRKRNLK